jgi:hypothetical protein
MTTNSPQLDDMPPLRRPGADGTSPDALCCCRWCCGGGVDHLPAQSKYCVDNFEKWLLICSGRKDAGHELDGPTLNQFIQDVIWKGSDTYRCKRLFASIAFRRKTFIIQDKCYVCNNQKNDTVECDIDNCLGRNYLYGWIYCPDCKPYVYLDKARREKNMDYLPASTHQHINNLELKYWRQPSTAGVLPYLVEDAKIEHEQNDAFEIKTKYNTLCSVVNWPVENASGSADMMVKAIPLANLVFYNRGIFGHSANIMSDKFLSKSAYINDSAWFSKWMRVINIQYTHANGWLEFYRVATRNNIPRELILNIMNYWGMFSLGTHCKNDLHNL